MQEELLRYNKSMLFSELAKEFQEIEKTTLRNEMMERIASILKRASKEEIKELVYLLMGQLRPKFDRLEFNLADKMVMRAIQFIESGKTLEVVKREYQEVGDLGNLIENYLKEREKRESTKYFADSSTLNVEQVYDELSVIATASGAGSQDIKVKRLASLLSSLDSLSAKYIVRIVLGKLRLGFSDKTILDALSYMESGSKEAREILDQAYQVAPDVGELAELVKEMGAKRAREAVRIVLGRPMSPQLAQRLRTADEMIAKMGTVEVEPKYDGTRVQIHFSKKRKEETASQAQNGLFGEEQAKRVWVRTFTRNLDENTAMFPELQQIAGQIQAEEVILDSEAVGYEPRTGKMVPFQLTITRKRKHGVETAVSAVPLKFFVFDILYKDGESLIDKPLRVRREILQETVKAVGKEDVLVVDEAITTDDPATLRDFHKQQLDKGLEGALVKKIEGKYLPGRQDWNWVKFKEEEGAAGKLSDTVDAVVLGYYKGKGKRQQFGVGAFLVGIRGEEGQILTVAKIGTGLTDEQFRELFNKLTKQQTNEKDKTYMVNKLLEPDLWVKPEIVVEIAADEVTVSPAHSSGYALRFPRLVRFREDKKAEEITTLVELKEIAGV